MESIISKTQWEAVKDRVRKKYAKIFSPGSGYENADLEETIKRIQFKKGRTREQVVGIIRDLFKSL